MRKLRKIQQDIRIYVFVPHVVMKHLTAVVVHARMKYALNVEPIWSEKEDHTKGIFNKQMI